jgi:glutamate/tyrosine decarboxylase-like PLP-dependent enzyme
MGPTGSGSVDPLSDILELRDRYGFRLHADAAYGGYFKLDDNLDSDTKKAFDGLTAADSIVIDPHKHGLQPYGCGCILYRDPGVGKCYKHDSPYTYFTSTDLHLGEISLECSSPGASAVALAEKNLHLATFKYPSSLLHEKWRDVNFDRPEVVCLRSCWMKPEHYGWIENIWAILDDIANIAMD